MIAFSDFGPDDMYNTEVGSGIFGTLSQGFEFTSVAAGEVSEIKLAIRILTGNTGDFSLDLYQDNGSTAGSPLSATLLGSFGGEASPIGWTGAPVDLVLPNSNVFLSSGQKYWLVARTSSSSLSWMSNNQGSLGGWEENGTVLLTSASATLPAFAIKVAEAATSTPEPTSLALALTGLGFGIIQLRKCGQRRRVAA